MLWLLRVPPVPWEVSIVRDQNRGDDVEEAVLEGPARYGRMQTEELGKAESKKLLAGINALVSQRYHGVRREEEDVAD